jgi:hypothetical protein
LHRTEQAAAPQCESKTFSQILLVVQHDGSRKGNLPYVVLPFATPPCYPMLARISLWLLIA